MRWLQSNPMVAYDEDLKKKFASESRKLMKEIEANIPLISESKIDFNPAGIAVSGDTTLRLMSSALGFGIYISLHTPSTHGLMFRRMSHMKDYTGGPNCWLELKDYKNAKEVADRIMAVMKWITTSEGESREINAY